MAINASQFPSFYRCPREINITKVTDMLATNPHHLYFGSGWEDKGIFEHFFSEPVKLMGTFVEAGGYDGVTSSNSLFFEQLLDWRGILVEANPTKCVEIWPHRPQATTFCSALCNNSRRHVQFYSRHGTSAVASEVDKKYVRSWGLKESDKVSVPCVSLGAILKTIGMTHLDYFSLDVQGSELTVLKSIDWDFTSIYVMLIEFEKASDDYEIRAFLRSKGFVESDFDIRLACDFKRDNRKSHVINATSKRVKKHCASNEVWVYPNYDTTATPSVYESKFFDSDIVSYYTDHRRKEPKEVPNIRELEAPNSLWWRPLIDEG
jgi:FkbM family methyltransferase